jgi:hypothetical protein
MKQFYTSVLAILVTVTIVGMLTIGTQQIYAPRTCGECAEFKKLTHEFEKAVIAAVGDPDQISRLVDEYGDNVKELFASPPPSP